MKLIKGQTISDQLQELVNMELTRERINEIGRKHKIQNASLIFEGVVNVSYRNTNLIIEVVKEAIRYRTERFPKDV